MNGSKLFTWWKSTLMYAVPASKREGSMLLIVPHFGSPPMFAVTLVHVAPPSRVTCTSPSFDPAQITPFCTGDSAIANSVEKYSTPRLSGERPPDGPSLLVSFVVRSGLITVQLCPPSVVRCTYWLPTYTVL